MKLQKMCNIYQKPSLTCVMPQYDQHLFPDRLKYATKL